MAHDPSSSGGDRNETIPAGTIAYADDMALEADNENELQKIIDIVGTFAGGGCRI